MYTCKFWKKILMLKTKPLLLQNNNYLLKPYSYHKQMSNRQDMDVVRTPSSSQSVKYKIKFV